MRLDLIFCFAFLHSFEHDIIATTMEQVIQEQASTAAQAHMATWIQATLREVALQILIQSCAMVDEETYQLHEDAVQQAQAACDAVAQRWKERLCRAGFHIAAAWIDRVVESGRETLYYQQSPFLPRATQNNTSTRQEESIVPGNLTTLGRLWSLQCPQPENSTEEPDPATVIDQLDAWGRAGHTDWPHDWSLVHKLVQEIPERRCFPPKSHGGRTMLHPCYKYPIHGLPESRPNWMPFSTIRTMRHPPSSS